MKYQRAHTLYTEHKYMFFLPGRRLLAKQKAKQHSPHSLDGDGLEDVFPPASAHTEATDARRDGIRMIKKIRLEWKLSLSNKAEAEKRTYNRGIEYI